MRLGSALAAGIILAVISNLAYASRDLPSAPIRPDSFKSHQEFTDYQNKLKAYIAAVGKPRLGRELTEDLVPNMFIAPQQVFSLIDTDHDNCVSLDEFQKFFS